jgi:hypothetical protein
MRKYKQTWILTKNSHRIWGLKFDITKFVVFTRCDAVAPWSRNTQLFCGFLLVTLKVFVFCSFLIWFVKCEIDVTWFDVWPQHISALLKLTFLTTVQSSRSETRHIPARLKLIFPLFLPHFRNLKINILYTSPSCRNWSPNCSVLVSLFLCHAKWN